MIVIETNRLILRQFEVEDAMLLMSVFGDAEVMQYGDGIQTLVWVKNWVRDIQDSYRSLGYGKWAIMDKDNATFLGYCGLGYTDDVCGKPEVAIGYRLAREYWGQGYASEAVSATRDYGLNVLRLERLVATIDPNNFASIRVAEKAGMVYGKDVMYAGYTHPDRVYVAEK